MKWILILLLSALSTTKVCNQVQIPTTMKTKITLEHDWIYGVFKRVGVLLHANQRIQITPDEFAKYCMIVGWCESNLDPTADSNGQQGIFQFTKGTRSKLFISDNITGESATTQAMYYYRFLKACSHKSLRAIRSSEDLHMLNFKPFGKRSCRVTKNTKALDFDGDGYITPNDLRLFQKKRIKENSVIEEMYNSLNA